MFETSVIKDMGAEGSGCAGGAIFMMAYLVKTNTSGKWEPTFNSP